MFNYFSTIHTKNVSQLLLVLSGIHSLAFQYAEKPTYKRERFAIFSERQFKCGRLNESSNKANAFNHMSAKPIARICGRKGTTKNRHKQIKIVFLRNFYSILVYIQKKL